VENFPASQAVQLLSFEEEAAVAQVPAAQFDHA
jgi:hypothetical protein